MLGAVNKAGSCSCTVLGSRAQTAAKSFREKMLFLEQTNEGNIHVGKAGSPATHPWKCLLNPK